VTVLAHPQTLRGIALMLAAMAILPFLDVCAKILGRQGVPVIEVVWARMVFGTLFTLPFAWRAAGAGVLVPARPVVHGFRAAFLIGATAFFFLGLQYMPIADTLAIFFVQPLVVTALSPFVLGERVDGRRWAAVVVGFLGTLVIIRPGIQAVNAGVLFALAAGLSMALYMLMTRRIAGSAPAVVTTFQTNLAGAALASLAVAPVFEPPAPQQWGLFVLLAVIAGVGHYLIVRAYDLCQASLLAPLAYSEMIMATAAGWWFFGDLPDVWTFAGVGILIGSAVVISLGEHGRLALAEREFEQP
jgi:drug/metabolite transporter (DMT)-like permease